MDGKLEEIFRNNNLDLQEEYENLYDLFFGWDNINNTTIYNYIGERFGSFDPAFTGTSWKIEQYDKKVNRVHGRTLPDPKHGDSAPSFEDLIHLCEYSSTLIREFMKTDFYNDIYIQDNDYIGIEFCAERIKILMETIDFRRNDTADWVFYLPNTPEAIVVAESGLLLEKDAYQLLTFFRHSSRDKKDILMQVARTLEGYEKILAEFNSGFEDNLRKLLNNVDIRHNNIAETSKNFKQVVASMSDSDIEAWYDDVYDMCLLSFMIIKYSRNKSEIKDLKKNI